MHPAKYFILYLMSTGHADAEDNEWIRTALEQLDLFERLATNIVLNQFRAEIKLPKNYHPTSRTHVPTIRFQKELRVRDLHMMTPTCKRANDIRENSAAREKAEVLLLSFATFPIVAKQINRLCRTAYTADDIGAFYHFFFNVELLSRHQWQDAIRRRGRGAYYKAALVGSPDLARWRMGENITVETREALELAFTTGYMFLQELRGMPFNIATVAMYNKTVDGLVKTHQAMGEAEVRMKDMMEQLERFKQSKRQIEIPGVDTLVSHSGQLKEEKIKQLLPPGDNNIN